MKIKDIGGVFAAIIFVLLFAYVPFGSVSPLPVPAPMPRCRAHTCTYIVTAPDIGCAVPAVCARGPTVVLCALCIPQAVALRHHGDGYVLRLHPMAALDLRRRLRVHVQGTHAGGYAQAGLRQLTEFFRCRGGGRWSKLGPARPYDTLLSVA